MDYDSSTGTLYMAAFNNANFRAELRSVDTTTGNTTLLGTLGSGTNQFGWVAFEQIENACLTGSVNAANGSVTTTLYVNGSSGGPDRTVEANVGDLTTATMIEPLAGGNGKFVLHADHGNATSGAPMTLPFDVGTTCYPFFVNQGATPVIVANNLGKTNVLGSSEFFGTLTEDPGRATTTLFFPELPLGTELTFQGIVIDPGSVSSKSASATNAVTLRVLP